ncbi:MAG: hypothetical protein JWM28_790 [Chitinophagaceae bacterium]|nr:hypothetical protein [Chitinophagaceae bacterium]
MKKLLLIGSFLIAFTGVWMTSCEPSKKGSGSPDATDSLSTQSSSMDTTMHVDTAHQNR